jgi:hypothetical protein
MAAIPRSRKSWLATVTLDRPERRNALDVGLARALRDALSRESPALHFDRLRKEYRPRREFPHTAVVVSGTRTTLAASDGKSHVCHR